MERVPLAEAAQRLGLTVDATRKRIKRGLLAATKDDDGRWYVTLPNADGRGGVDTTAMRMSTRMDEDLRAEVVFLRERLQEAERERAELRRMLNLEQQNVARLLPATVPDAPHAPERAADDVIPHAEVNIFPEGAQREPAASWRVRLRRWLGR